MQEIRILYNPLSEQNYQGYIDYVNRVVKRIEKESSITIQVDISFNTNKIINKLKTDRDYNFVIINLGKININNEDIIYRYKNMCRQPPKSSKTLLIAESICSCDEKGIMRHFDGDIESLDDNSLELLIDKYRF